MAFVLQKGQFPVGCQLCENENKIQWKCSTCDLLMCDVCKDGVHLRIANDHEILNINQIGKSEVSKATIISSDVKCDEHYNQACCLYCNTCNKVICFKCITEVHYVHELIEDEDKGKEELKPKQNCEIKLEKTKVYTTDLTHINCIAVRSDGSMWMGAVPEQLYNLSWAKLEQIDTMTGVIANSRYDVKPLGPVGIHVTSAHRVSIGAQSGGKVFPDTGKRVVVVMDQEGNQLKEYDHKKRLFIHSACVTCNSNGNICVLDRIGHDRRGRVVVSTPGGDVLGMYTGHPDVNTGEKPFVPVGLLPIPSDNIVVSDVDNDLLHILSDKGQIITYYILRAMRILCPYSLALSKIRTIYIGCVNMIGDTKTAKLYELNYTGF